MYGWAGTILRVDLSSGTTERQPLKEDLCNHFIGGRGISAKILFDEVGPEIEPLSPHNRLIFSCGPLSGTSAPCPARFHVTGKSPLTGIMGNSNAGGYFGPALWAVWRTRHSISQRLREILKHELFLAVVQILLIVGTRFRNGYARVLHP